MTQPWTVYEWEECVSDAVDIAMGYLEGTGHGDDIKDLTSLVTTIVMARCRQGMKNKIRLANAAIVTVEKFSKRQKQATLVDL